MTDEAFCKFSGGTAGRGIADREGKSISWVAFNSDKNKSLFLSGLIMSIIINLPSSGCLNSWGMVPYWGVMTGLHCQQTRQEAIASHPYTEEAHAIEFMCICIHEAMATQFMGLLHQNLCGQEERMTNIQDEVSLSNSVLECLFAVYAFWWRWI